MDIYIKPKRKILIIGKKAIYLKDIGEIFVSGGVSKDIENIIVTTINSEKDCEKVISVMDIVKAINLKYPNATVSNLGETDTLVEYQIKSRKVGGFIETIKIIFVSAVLFAGSVTAIMSFHADAEIPKIFGNFSYMLSGEYNENNPIITVPYGIGLGVGIIVFFNHFSKKYITKDPTPIEVQMTTYEKETTDSIIATLEKEERKTE